MFHGLEEWQQCKHARIRDVLEITLEFRSLPNIFCGRRKLPASFAELTAKLQIFKNIYTQADQLAESRPGNKTGSCHNESQQCFSANYDFVEQHI